MILSTLYSLSFLVSLSNDLVFHVSAYILAKPYHHLGWQVLLSLNVKRHTFWPPHFRLLAHSLLHHKLSSFCSSGV